ncbi:MAG: hypothetical protein II063_00780, partial [Prevotella sp.]|nr:hypothetical protein [Prevotella sp.]
IDGYKKVGAGCSDTREFVDINGNSLADKKFYIDCRLETYGTLSYQDSFRYYNYNEEKAYNYSDCHYSYCLDTTDGSIDGNDDDDDPQEYDSYHDADAYEVVTVYVHGERETCDIDRLDDFIEINGTYYHEDDVTICRNCGKRYLSEDGVYSEITDNYYCCEECRQKADETYKQQHWYYSDYDQSYFEDTKDLTTYLHWDWNVVNYEVKTISKHSLDKYSDQFHLYEGVYYDRLNPITGLPYYVKETEEVAA